MGLMSEDQAGRLLVGTSGFSYPDWKGAFYPEGLPSHRWLGFYAERFGAVEINQTFYRPASSATLARWCDAVPDDFAFVLKANRTITHEKKLIGCRPELEEFARQVAPMGGRLASILFQLPPSLKAEPARLSPFLDAASEAFDATPAPPLLAIEFRHPSWYEDETLASLRRRGWAVVVHDMMKSAGWNVASESVSVGGMSLPLAEFLDRDARRLYLRFHGPTGRYQGEYGAEKLKRHAAMAGMALRRGATVLAFFNNTIASAAPRDAAAFQHLLGVDRPAAEEAGPWTLGTGRRRSTGLVDQRSLNTDRS
jgi:uncharacterized protein YecE (DUF72 family)